MIHGSISLALAVLDVFILQFFVVQSLITFVARLIDRSACLSVLPAHFAQLRICRLPPRGSPVTTGFDWDPPSTACTPSRLRYDTHRYSTPSAVCICDICIFMSGREHHYSLRLSVPRPTAVSDRRRLVIIPVITPHISTRASDFIQIVVALLGQRNVFGEIAYIAQHTPKTRPLYVKP